MAPNILVSFIYIGVALILALGPVGAKAQVEMAALGPATAGLYTGGASALIAPDTAHDSPAQTNGASLFAGQQVGGLFAPLPPRLAAPPLRRPQVTGTGPYARLRDLIAAAEAGPAGYDAVQHGARIRPNKPPTQMTLAEIEAWTRATPGQPHAIGRYQFIPNTLRMLVRRAGLPPHTRFSPAVQDWLADMLLADAGVAKAMQGQMDRITFMNNLAGIWAGLPTSSGKSRYHGQAGNKATISWAKFSREMSQILPG